MKPISFNHPFVPPQALDYVQAVLESDRQSGDGPMSERAATMLAAELGGGPTFLTPSGTDALELAALALDLGPGDEVIVPSFTFTSSANAFALLGAVPVFVDIRPDTFNVDVAQIEAAVTERTRAVVPVHYGGVACDMDELTALAERLDLHVIEDNAHGLGGTYRGRPLGSIGRLAAQSFHETKNVQCGEGGALVVNDPSLVLPVEIGREKGTDRSSFWRGEVDKYTWRGRGSSDLMPEITAALLVAQLESFEHIQSIRSGIWNTYRDGLDEWAHQHGVQFQAIPSECVHPSHLFAFLLPTADQRTDFIRHMADEGVMTVFHYVPLHDSPAGRLLGRTSPEGCATTTDVSSRLVRLPLHPHLSADDVELVVAAASAWKP